MMSEPLTGAYRGYLIHKHPWNDEDYWVTKDGQLICRAASREDCTAAIDELTR